MGEISLLYFLEDIAHEKFLCALVNRIAQEQGIGPSQLVHTVRNATGGKGKALAELTRFLREHQRLQCHILIVAIDANCQKYTARRNEILKRVPQETQWQVVCAIPDPYIERWYPQRSNRYPTRPGFLQHRQGSRPSPLQVSAGLVQAGSPEGYPGECGLYPTAGRPGIRAGDR